MNEKDMFEGFDVTEIEKFREKYKEEVRQKYDPDIVEECERKVQKYSENDWAEISARANEIFKKIALLMDKEPDNPEVQEAVNEWRKHISDNFYNCTLEIFRGLADLYIEDERFRENIDKYKPGLADFLSKAMKIYCEIQNK